MKKFLEEKHDLLAGIFAVLAFIAIVCEIAFGGFTKEGLVGGIKDISGILIDVLVLLVAASVLIRRPVNFKEKFSEAMDRLEEKYEPLLIEDKKEGVIRYNVASNSDALFSRTAKSPERIFELAEDKPTKICFYINKSFFNQRGGADYDAEKIASQIALRLQAIYKDYDIKPFPNGTNYGIEVDFKRTLDSDDDITALISLIDYTILLFVARNKS
ncbi:MAG: hypothetical protein IJO52_09060 [Clostridia bacterium]|nr:hypothetical protein [Clostridia bacterium]